MVRKSALLSSLGYWAGSQAERFNRHNLKLVLGISDRVLRGILIKKFRSACKAHGVYEEAVVQNFQHNEDVQDAVYMSGLRNEVNSMAQFLYRWGRRFTLLVVTAQCFHFRPHTHGHRYTLRVMYDTRTHAT